MWFRVLTGGDELESVLLPSLIDVIGQINADEPMAFSSVATITVTGSVFKNPLPAGHACRVTGFYTVAKGRHAYPHPADVWRDRALSPCDFAVPSDGPVAPLCQVSAFCR